MARIAIIHYSLYGHVAKLAESIKKGVIAAGSTCDIYRVAETLPEEVLAKMHAPPKGDYPVMTADKMTEYDAFMFGVSGRYGSVSAQMRAFLDSTGQLWQSGALVGKGAGVFFSTAVQGGGQETIGLTMVPFFTHHGMVFIPLGYTDPKMFNNEEAHGGSAYGAGTLAGGDGSRQPSELELGLAESHGKHFAKIASKLAYDVVEA
jgi:NAD(P)H dehydrogenase (quinone)